MAFFMPRGYPSPLVKYVSTWKSWEVCTSMISSSLVTLMSPSSETLLGGKALGAAVASHGFGMSWGRMDTRMGLSAFLIVSWTSYHNCKKHQASCWKLSWTLAEVLHPAGLLIFLSSILFNPQVLFRTTYMFTYNLRFQCSQVWFFSFL